MSKRILITRPQPNADKTAKAVKRIGYEPIIYPLLVLNPASHNIPDYSDYDAVIITSINTLSYIDFKHIPESKPIFTLGHAIEQTLREKGYKNISSIAQKAKDIRLDPDKKYVHLSGRDVQYEFDNMVCKRVIVYEATMLSNLSEGILNDLKQDQINTITLYSARTAQCFKHLVNRYDLTRTLNKISVVCISQNVLNCINTLQWHSTYVAEEPNEKSMLSLLKRLYND